MNILLMYNPKSGHKMMPQLLDKIIHRVQDAGHQLLPYRLDGYECIQTYFDSIDFNKIDRVWIAGGDGSVNTVVNVLMSRAIDVPIGLFPMGTANDYAYYFELPKDLDKQIDIALGHVMTKVDVGKMNEKYFVNVASLGGLIDVSHKTDTVAKNTLGMLAYYIKGLEEISTMRSIDVHLTLGETEIERSIYFLLVMNGKSAGGFRKVGNFADMSDGLFDVIIFNKCPVFEMMGLLIKVMNGEHVNSDYVEYFQTDTLFIQSKEDIPSDIDGEIGLSLPLHIVNLSKKLRILTKTAGIVNLDEAEFQRVMGIKKVVRHMKKSMLEKSVVTVTQIKDLSKLMLDFPRHSALYYVNRKSLSEAYFDKVMMTLNDPYIYLILSQTGSPAGEIIRKITNKPYSHASLSFDENLETIVSYNGGEGTCFPGLNQEVIQSFHQKEDASIIVYKIKATKRQKKRMIDKIKIINEQGSSYNYLGFLWSYTFKENIMFCSQFVYTLLEVAELHYFDKKPSRVMPMDFLELDEEDRLEFCSKHMVCDLV